jgi:hypothetical protein
MQQQAVKKAQRVVEELPTDFRSVIILCELEGLSTRNRHFDVLGPALRSVKAGVRELRNGYAFQFADPATVALVAEWAAGERACCPFFDIDLKFDREGGPFWLSLTGREPHPLQGPQGQCVWCVTHVHAESRESRILVGREPGCLVFGCDDRLARNIWR